MKDEESQKAQTTNTSFSIKKYGQGFEELFSRGKYKFWALAAIVLLAFWSMFTGSVTLKFSAVDLKLSSHDSDSSTHADLDVLAVDAREKLVKEMWDAYKYSRIIRLPSFFRDAFGAAYQDLTSEVSGVRDAAFLEIAKMSFMSTEFYQMPSVQSTTW
ncbi:hypothetical protein F511_21723 [Dorcoceras hygrometricum]|uniref:Uncharacterized protein n=1 Tax=Dorcoceras hygrometricum TaxID=472368 RepID=A0A2Z7BQ44_9LAMI|nr:hypothetical protein F511_21723 [Dorcoceras hygrometricum]